MRHGVVIKYPDCVFSIAAPTIHKSIKELEQATSIVFFLSKDLMVDDTPDVRCNYYHHPTP